MNKTEAYMLAAQAWCAPKTSSTVVNPVLAEEFAAILMGEVNSRIRLIDGLHAQNATLARQLECLQYDYQRAVEELEVK